MLIHWLRTRILLVSAHTVHDQCFNPQMIMKASAPAILHGAIVRSTVVDS